MRMLGGCIRVPPRLPCCPARPQVPTVQTALTELTALERLYDSLNGDNWITRMMWTVRDVQFTTDPCTNQWYGIICDDSLHIVGINLSNNRCVTRHV